MHISSFFIFLFFNDVYFLFILRRQQDDAAPPLPDDRGRGVSADTDDEDENDGPPSGRGVVRRPGAIVDADEADAVIGDGALVGVAAPPAPAPLAAIIPAEDSAEDSMYGGHGGLPVGRRGSESSCNDGRGHRRPGEHPDGSLEEEPRRRGSGGDYSTRAGS